MTTRPVASPHGDHGRETVVRMGRTSANLGREPDPPGRSIALTCEVGGSPSEPRSHDRGHRVAITSECQILVTRFSFLCNAQ